MEQVFRGLGRRGAPAFDNWFFRHIITEYLCEVVWKGAWFCFGLFNDSNSSSLRCVSPSVGGGLLVRPGYPLERASIAAVVLLPGGLLVPACVPARRGGLQRCRKMLKYEQKALPVNDFKVCSWKREGERVLCCLEGGTNAALQRSQDTVMMFGWKLNLL